MEPNTFTQPALGIQLTVQPFTQRLYVAFSRAYQTHRPGPEMTIAEDRDTFIKAALDCGWITTEPPITLETVGDADPAVVNWIVNGRGPKSLASIYIEAASLPKD